ncbi:hypothetical protein VSR69_43670 [Paraburkholderia phytofirmans]|jgi:hypothetical protein|uniref:hypothetical protein n=1 Tax=Paraburkholderia sp. BL9I2N2 TaxID=1938809 RepID=UPI001048541D|nr:hypothetical protein [Paraburkholderia sp. BL9I2N2]TCK86235.1 hypothetical protein B0G74_8781 [Paraburkholderia sp. BL9I2N2]
MFRKFLSIAVIAIGSNVIAAEVVVLPQAWHDSHYASCYSSLKAGMSDTYGISFEEDKNILRIPRHMGLRYFVIASDTTSGTNSQKTVFEQRSSTNWCVVLASPPVAALVPGPVSATLRRPLTWTSVTQAPPGFPEMKVLYKWNSKDLIYVPANCYKGNDGRWKSFNCNEAYQ